jgi:hypothetical protein
MKNAVTPSTIEHASSQFVAQCLNHLHHRLRMHYAVSRCYYCMRVGGGRKGNRVGEGLRDLHCAKYSLLSRILQ